MERKRVSWVDNAAAGNQNMDVEKMEVEETNTDGIAKAG